jgi:hypothetical protein
MEPVDLSSAHASIQVSLRALGLTFGSARVQAWLRQAEARFVERCAQAGDLPLPPPPWRSRAELPNEVLINLAQVLERARGENPCTPARRGQP